MDIDTRHNQLVLISKRVEKANEKINEILEKLGWTRSQLKQWQTEQKKVMICPFDKRHQVPPSTMKEHYRQCLYKSRGTQMVKETRPPSSLFFYQDAPSIVSFVDPQTKIVEPHKNIIETLPPQQEYYVEELKAIPTIEEKRQAYDQMIERSKQLRLESHRRQLVTSAIDRRVHEKQNRLKKKAHEDQQQLNKRKRKQYRIKMKMITPTEIQRELINAYMQEYKDWSK
ncbi:uncharacterized protein EV154DRAFT_503531 [Mucor mucedo]|uniref:uncharacterized protein n=1 Tax=Mucor mucedo TaxID=29922 RepID=UPI0022210CC9|nr:uncharacterized protein EV154DRAFT_503531 [Mucor mucedo]KAI7892980.1 hypothetical protein EV154DRAFT_503531 [Mucor mucedo]